ncbi:glycosyltransferase [Streptomyces sp. NPDC059002]|uniref:glycosyltransferase n=1 Tax=Streptomyces sp. NPDC059002 TaxID=3346690 RepID=UPI0036BB0B56
MKALFQCEAGEGTIFPLVPLAQALRSAGHEVFLAGHPTAVRHITAAGLPGVTIPQKEPREFARTDGEGNIVPFPSEGPERYAEMGRVAGLMAVDTLAGYRTLARSWRPDVVIGSPQAYAATLLAAELSVPRVEFTLDMSDTRPMDRAVVDALRPQLAELGRTSMPGPDLVVSPCPQSVRPPDAKPALIMRHVPYSSMRPLEPWMYAKGERPRILVTAGSRVSRTYALDYLRSLIGAAARLDAEVIVAVPDEVVPDLGPLPEGAHAGWMPADVVVPTCDLVIHQAGGITMTCMVSGVPQLVVPFMAGLDAYAERLVARGAARMVRTEDAEGAALADAARDVLGTTSFLTAAAALRDEVLAAPSPGDVAARLERLVSAARN